MGILLLIFSACSQGMMWSIMAVGLYITYKILDYADLTVDGSLALGGSVSAVMIFNGVNPFISLIVATFAGMIAGLITGILHTKLKVPAILSGILTMISLYSVNIRIMGKANISLLGKNTVFSYIERLVPDKYFIISDIGTLNISIMILGLAVSLMSVIVLYWFFGTEIGSAIRATGDNPSMARSFGINTDAMKIIGLALSNGLVALSGSFITQSQGYGDINMGTGTIVIGLASIIIGEAAIKNNGKFAFAIKLISVIAGSVVYRIIIACVLSLGMNSSDLKVFTAVIVAVALCIPKIKIRGGSNVRA